MKFQIGDVLRAKKDAPYDITTHKVEVEVLAVEGEVNLYVRVVGRRPRYWVRSQHFNLSVPVPLENE